MTQNRTLTRILPVALGLLAMLPLAAATPAPKRPEVRPLQVTYFFLPG